MKRWPVWLHVVIGVVVAAGAAGGVALLVTMWRNAAATSPAPQATDAGADDIAFWTCVMHPTVRQSGPGQCPVCQMDLIPARKGAGLTLTKRQKDLVPVRTEPVGYHALAREIRTVGTLTYNERKLAVASTRVSGWIERLYVDFTGTRVRADYTCPDHPDQRFDSPGECPECTKPLERHADHLVEIYSPELLVAQDEYLVALKGLAALGAGASELSRSGSRALVTSAEVKLRLLGLTQQQIDEIRQRGTAVTTLTLYAPIGGTVIEVKARLGQHVKAGADLFRVADLNTLWMLADIYEYELPWLRRGMVVEITGDAFPGEVVHGRIAFVYPFLHAETRTVKALVEVPNEDRRLKPGMAVTARLRVSLAEIHARDRAPLPPYACPMHPWITSESPGHCSICGMPLEPVERSERAEAGAHSVPASRPAASAPRPATRTVLTCGMPGHPQYDPDEAPADGTCPICKMKLAAKTIRGKTGDINRMFMSPVSPETRPAAPRLRFKYVCPDHPEVVSEEPGTCPKDGKPLAMTGEVLAVPKSAVIDTGERAVVYVDQRAAGYVAREVALGPEGWTVDDAGNRLRRYVPILRGLEPGAMVVTQGNFLIDSQSQITGAAAQAYGGQIGGGEEAPAPQHRH